MQEELERNKNRLLKGLTYYAKPRYIQLYVPHILHLLSQMGENHCHNYISINLARHQKKNWRKRQK